MAKKVAKKGSKKKSVAKPRQKATAQPFDCFQKNEEGLNEKQQRFCDEYLVDFNATQAAIRAGYSEKTAGSQGHDLLKKPEIQWYLQNKKEKIADKLEISQTRVMQEIARLAFSDIRKLFTIDGALKPVGELDDDAAAILSSLEILEEKVSDVDAEEQITAGTVKKVKLWDKTKALEMLAKHFKIYSDAPVSNNIISVGYGKEE
jgi:phage terminase small subunit